MRVQRFSPALLAGVALTLAGCGGSPVTVEVVADGPSGPVPQANIEVRMFPFDRDSVFDALDAQASTPKPQVSEDMLQTFGEIGVLQEQWRAKDTEWAESRDQLQTLSEQLQGLDRRSRDYMQKYDQFGELETRVNRLEREKVALFQEFTSLQESVATRVDSFRIARNSWEENTYAEYFDIEQELLKAAKAEILADTTGAEGTVTMKIPSGNWWLVSRVPTARGELYWNIRLDPGATETIRLSPENGEDRVRF